MLNLFYPPRVKNYLFLLWLVMLIVLMALSQTDLLNKIIQSDIFSFKLGSAYFSLFYIIVGALTTGFLWWSCKIILYGISKYIARFDSLTLNNRNILLKVAQIFLYFFAFILWSHILNMDFSGLSIFSGALGIGIGIGLQKISSNFISGFVLAFEGSIKVGDIISFPSNNIYGTVKALKARYTVLETPQSQEVIIPNEDMLTDTVINYTFSNTMYRVEVDMTLPYSRDPELLQQWILEEVKSNPMCMEEPEPMCYIKNFGIHGIEVNLFFWISDINNGTYKVKNDVMVSIWNRWKKEGIEFPYNIFTNSVPQATIKEMFFHTNKRE